MDLALFLLHISVPVFGCLCTHKIQQIGEYSFGSFVLTSDDFYIDKITLKMECWDDIVKYTILYYERKNKVIHFSHPKIIFKDIKEMNKFLSRK